MPTTSSLTATFTIPKARIKNANTPMNHIVAAQKSAWLRDYAETVWREAVEAQLGLTALEPPMESYPPLDLPPEAQEYFQELEDLQEEALRLQEEQNSLESLKEVQAQRKRDLKVALKEKRLEEAQELEEALGAHERQMQEVKSAKARVKATLASKKRLQGQAMRKEMLKAESARRRGYLQAKLALNRERLPFTTCAVVVRVHNITAREFDAANFSPTLKPLLDAATDTCIIWPDDNNSVLQGGVLFIAGPPKARHEYVLTITILPQWPWQGLHDNVLLEKK